MRVAVDGRVLVDRYHGIGRYTWEVLRRLAADDLRLAVLLPPDTGRIDTAPLLARADVVTARAAAAPVSAGGQRELHGWLHRMRPDVLLSPYHLAAPLPAARCAVVPVVHDCMFERGVAATPGGPAAGWAFRSGYRVATATVLATAARAVTISQASRSDLTRFYRRVLPPTDVVGHGVSDRFALVCRRPHDVPDGSRRYVLTVGVRRPHKNQRVLLEALARLPAELSDVGLVVVGQRDDRVPDELPALVERLGLDGRVRLAEDVGDAELGELYAGAAAFAFPSLAEGFGLPVLEAMAAGVPVVCSDADAVVEAGGGAAVVVPARNPDAWAGALAGLLSHPAAAADRVAAGRVVAAARTWDAAAGATLAVLRAAAG